VVVALAPDPLELERDLILDRHDVIGQEPMQAERVALVGRECEVLRQEPMVEERAAVDADPGRLARGDG
jgi:hypothetical protein